MTEIVTKLLNRLYPNVDTQTVLMESDALKPIDAVIRRIEPLVDGLIFTGKTPYDLMNQAILSQKPWVYIKRDMAQLLMSLLMANRLHHWDTALMSVDSYEVEEVQSLCRQIGIPIQLPAVYPKRIVQEGFLTDLARFHRQNIMTGKSQFCITGISSVFEVLQQQDVPCLILDPTEESVRDAMQLLMLKRESRLAEDRQMVVIAIEQDLPDEHALIRENEYQMALESMGITEQVYLFAQRIQAAVVDREMGKFLLFTTKHLLEAETEGFKRLGLLNQKTENRFGTLSIGIGYGETAREAKFNANQGLLKSKKGGGNQAFLVSNQQTIGPLFVTEGEAREEKAKMNGYFQIAAEKTGVSLNTILKMQSMMDFEQKNTYTATELASSTRLSLRSVNRLLDKLMQAGYAQIVGSQMQEKTGRPSRVIRIAFSTDAWHTS